MRLATLLTLVLASVLAGSWLWGDDNGLGDKGLGARPPATRSPISLCPTAWEPATRCTIGSVEAGRGGLRRHGMPAGQTLWSAVGRTGGEIPRPRRAVRRHRLERPGHAARDRPLRPGAQIDFPILKDAAHNVADAFGSHADTAGVRVGPGAAHPLLGPHRRPIRGRLRPPCPDPK